MIHLVTDSTSDCTAEIAERLGVRVVPLTVRLGDREYRDSVDIDGDTFYRRLAGGDAQPSTSQPSPQDFAAVYGELLASPDDSVVSIHISAKLSGTSQSAELAAKQFDAGRVRVVDSGSVSAGIQFAVAAARTAIDGGAGIDDVVAAAEDAARRVQIFVMVDTLVYLQRGGRIGRASAFLGGVLNVKPVLGVEHGEVVPKQRVRGRQKGISTMLDLLHGIGELEATACMYTDSREEGDAMVARLRDGWPGLEPRYGQLGPVVGTYSGPGAIGIAGLRKG